MRLFIFCLAMYAICLVGFMTNFMEGEYGFGIVILVGGLCFAALSVFQLLNNVKKFK